MHRWSTKKRIDRMKDKFLTSVLFKSLYNLNLQESTKNGKSWFFNILKWNFQNYLILHVSGSVGKQTCFIQFLLKSRALNFRSIFLIHPVLYFWNLNLGISKLLNVLKVYFWAGFHTRGIFVILVHNFFQNLINASKRGVEKFCYK